MSPRMLFSSMTCVVYFSFLVEVLWNEWWIISCHVTPRHVCHGEVLQNDAVDQCTVDIYKDWFYNMIGKILYNFIHTFSFDNNAFVLYAWPSAVHPGSASDDPGGQEFLHVPIRSNNLWVNRVEGRLHIRKWVNQNTMLFKEDVRNQGRISGELVASNWRCAGRRSLS